MPEPKSEQYQDQEEQEEQDQNRKEQEQHDVVMTDGTSAAATPVDEDLPPILRRRRQHRLSTPCLAISFLQENKVLTSSMSLTTPSTNDHRLSIYFPIELSVSLHPSNPMPQEPVLSGTRILPDSTHCIDIGVLSSPPAVFSHPLPKTCKGLPSSTIIPDSVLVCRPPREIASSSNALQVSPSGSAAISQGMDIDVVPSALLAPQTDILQDCKSHLQMVI